jgi:5'-phosphate synthase pdxT subunit
MVIVLQIGILSVQGAISEHVEAVANAAASIGSVNVKVINIRRKEDLEAINALIIPGGESTTISKLMVKFDLFDKIIKRARTEDLPILGTCAGCIVLASEGDSEVKKTDTELLKLMDMRIDRNAFGRQRESFESDIKIDLPGFEKPFHAVFIRAPIIEEVWGDCRILSKLEGNVIFAQQENLLAAAFHPELTNDLRIHEYFLKLI